MSKLAAAVTDHRKEFLRLIGTLRGKHQLWRVFSDFCELSACAFANAFHKNAEREARYLKTIAGYDKEEQDVFPKLLGHLTLALEADPAQDFLGSVFMELELGSHWHGQFFTPMSICTLMAEMSLQDECGALDNALTRNGFITVQEPAVGAGAMVIAVAAVMRKRSLNPQGQMHVTAIDVDATAAHMAYVQFSLLSIPAVVIVGNTLAPDMDVRDTLYTPQHFLGLWDGKLRRGYALGFKGPDTAEVETEVPAAVTPEPAAPLPVVAVPDAPAGIGRKAGQQLRLF